MAPTVPIMRTVLVTTVCIAVCLAQIPRSSGAETPASGQQQQQQQQQQRSTGDVARAAAAAADDTRINNINATAVTDRLIRDYVTPAICTYSPGLCVDHKIQSRGIQSYLATAGTLFAGVLGVILTKIKILVVLSLITMITGKLLLLYAYIKSDPHHHHSYKHHHHVQPYVKYTRDKYFIKNTPQEHSHHVVTEEHSPYHGHGGGVSYYKRR